MNDLRLLLRIIPKKVQQRAVLKIRDDSLTPEGLTEKPGRWKTCQEWWIVGSLEE